VKATFVSDPELRLPAPPRPFATLSGPAGDVVEAIVDDAAAHRVAGERALVRGSGRSGPLDVFVHATAERSIPLLEELTLVVQGEGAIRSAHDASAEVVPAADGGAVEAMTEAAADPCGAAGAPVRPGDVEGAAAPPALRSPGLLRRGLPRGDVTEVTFVPRMLPGTVVQWAADVRGRVPLDVVLSWGVRAPAGADGVRYIQRGPFLRVAAGGEESLLFLVAGDALASWTVREPAAGEDPVLRVAVRLQISEEAPVHLVALAGDDPALADALAMLPHLPAHERRRHREAGEGRAERLAVEAPGGIGEALERARTDLDAAWIRPVAGGGKVAASLSDTGGRFPPLRGPDAATAALAALASGHAELADQLLSALATDAADGRFGAPWLHASAEYALWTGDVSALARDRELLERCVAGLAAPGAGEGAALRDASFRDTLALLADAVEPLGDRAWSTRLRELAERHPAARAGGGIALPVLGGTGPATSAGSGRTPGEGAAVDPGAGFEAGAGSERGSGTGAGAVAEPGSGRSPGTGAGAGAGRGARANGTPALVEWPGRSAFLAGDPDAGLRAWTAHLSRTAAAGADRTLDAALGLLPFTDGVLGARPDAGYGRLRLAPIPPSSWSAFTAANLSIGDAAVSLAYRKSGARHTFTLTQTAGRAPINLVFEPAVAGKGSALTVRLGGETVDVGIFERGDRLGVRLQLPLDHERRVTIEEAHFDSDERATR
jgi:hypothetical protein